MQSFSDLITNLIGFILVVYQINVTIRGFHHTLLAYLLFGLLWTPFKR